jgi:hypothetical protein
VPDDVAARGQAPTTYDLNPSNPLDPEATITRMPDLNKTVLSTPTSEIRKDTGPASPPPPQPTPTYQPLQPPPPAPSAENPTIAFNPSQPFNQAPPLPPQPPPPQYYQPSQQQPPQPLQQQYAQPYPQSPAQPPAYPPQQYAPAPPQQQHAPQAPKTAPRRKSSRLPLIIAVVVILLAGAAAAWYFLIYKKSNAGTNENASTANANSSTTASTNANTSVTANVNDNASTTANANTNANTSSVPPTTPPPNSTEFVNSKANLDGKLAEYYSDFSFYYPKSWNLDPTAGVPGAKNFVKVDRQEAPDFPQERFVVSYYESKGTFDADRSQFPKLVETYNVAFAKSFPDYRKVSEGETKVNGLDAYEFRFESSAKNTAKGDITYWGRVIFLPPGVEGEKNGITLLMLTSSLASEIKSANDVGVKGELPIILNSFRMGSS